MKKGGKEGHTSLPNGEKFLPLYLICEHPCGN